MQKTRYKYTPSYKGGTIRQKYKDGKLIETKKMPMKLTLIRHGETALNKEHRIRGWKDVPLNAHGVKEAEQVGEKLKGKGIEKLQTSDLKRATKTAHIVGKKIDAPVEKESKSFRPWNVGKFTAEKSNKVHKVLAEYARFRPNERIPGGESFNEFKNRFLNAIKALDKKNHNSKVGVVAHYRNEKIMQAWKKKGYSNDNSVDIDTFLRFNGDKPASVSNFKI